MASNALSKRRRVLKRPAVCKSKPLGDCGACVYTLDSPQQRAHPHEVCEFLISLDCDPDPDEKEFALLMHGAWVPTEPAPTLVVNSIASWHATAPALEGPYVVKIDAFNRHKCRFFGEINMLVENF